MVFLHLLYESGYAGVHDVHQGSGIESHPKDDDGQRHEDGCFSNAEVGQQRDRRRAALAQDHALQHPEHVGGGQNDAPHGQDDHDEAAVRGADEHQEFADEIGGARQAEGGDGKETQERGEARHRFVQPAVIADQATVRAVVQLADGQKQRAGRDPVIEHLEHGALDSLAVEGEDPQCDEAHVRDRGIGDELLEIRLRQSQVAAIQDGRY